MTADSEDSPISEPTSATFDRRTPIRRRISIHDDGRARRVLRRWANLTILGHEWPTGGIVAGVYQPCGPQSLIAPQIRGEAG